MAIDVYLAKEGKDRTFGAFQKFQRAASIRVAELGGGSGRAQRTRGSFVSAGTRRLSVFWVRSSTKDRMKGLGGGIFQCLYHGPIGGERFYNSNGGRLATP